jgi:hypothetical protein
LALNYHHPELKPGEMFLTNIFTEGGSLLYDLKMQDIRYQTARVGHKSFDKDGQFISLNCRPVFVKKWEYYLSQSLCWILPSLVAIALVIFLILRAISN